MCVHTVVLWVGNMDGGQDLRCIHVTRTERIVPLPLAMEAWDSGTQLLYETEAHRLETELLSEHSKLVGVCYSDVHGVHMTGRSQGPRPAAHM